LKCPNAVAIGFAASSCHACAWKATMRWALPDDRDICETVEGASRTQIVDGQADRLWRRCDAEFARHTDNRCSLQGPSRLVDGSFDGTAGIETLRAAIVDLITRSLPLTLGDMHLANTQQSQ
jgi:hypothetical protein